MIKINRRKGNIRLKGKSAEVLAEYAILGWRLYNLVIGEFGREQATTLMKELQSAAFMDEQEIEAYFTSERAREHAKTKEATNDQKQERTHHV